MRLRQVAPTNDRGHLHSPEFVFIFHHGRNADRCVDASDVSLAPGSIGGTYAWSKLLLGVPGMRVAGGTDEVMRNIVAERVLGLPKDPGIDSTTPFRDLKVGTQRD